MYSKISTFVRTVGLTRSAITNNPQHERRGLTIQNTGPDVLYVGDNTVTTANGFPLTVGDKLSIDGPLVLHGISVGSSNVRVLEFF